MAPLGWRLTALTSQPNLREDGFEIQHIPESIEELLANYREADSTTQKNIRQAIRSQLEEIVSKYFGLRAVALDSVYRNTKPIGDTSFKSIPFVHIDFPADELGPTFDAFEGQWKLRVEDSLDAGSYDPNQVEFMINVWMPVGSITASPLTLCSRELPNYTSRVHPYVAVRQDGSHFKALSLTPPPKDKEDPWVYLSHMDNRCYLFNSTEVVHSAAQFPEETDGRESIEVRLGLFKP